MKITYLGHAEQRMRQRQVTRADVEHALRNYTGRYVTPKNSIQYQGPATSGKVLKIWVFPDQDPMDDKVVKSVAWKDEL